MITFNWAVLLTNIYIHLHAVHLLTLELCCIWLLNILLQNFWLRTLVFSLLQASVWLVLQTRPEPAGKETTNCLLDPKEVGGSLAHPSLSFKVLQVGDVSWGSSCGARTPRLVELTVGAEELQLLLQGLQNSTWDVSRVKVTCMFKNDSNERKRDFNVWK